MKAVLSLLLCFGLTLIVQAADAPAAIGNLESFQVRNVQFDRLLRPEDANSANGTRIVLYSAQPWKCMTWKFHPAGTNLFQLENHFTGKTFAGKDTSAAAPVAQVPFKGANSNPPKWEFIKLTDGNYRIAEPQSGRVLTAVKPEGEFTVRIELTPWQDTAAQKWELLKTDPSKLTM